MSTGLWALVDGWGELEVSLKELVGLLKVDRGIDARGGVAARGWASEDSSMSMFSMLLRFEDALLSPEYVRCLLADLTGELVLDRSW